MEACKNKNITIIQNLFTLFLILYPITGLYATPLQSVSIADFILIISIPFLFLMLIKLNRKVKDTISFPMLGLLIFLIFHLLMCIPFVGSGSLFDITMSSFRYILYLLALALFIKTYFNWNVGLKQLRFVSVGVSCYLILQYLLYTFLGIYLPGTIPFLNFMSSSINDIYHSYNLGHTIRVCSVFAEPSHFSTYVILFLMIDLLIPKKQFIEYVDSIIISIALFLSKSSAGIIMCLLVWLFWLLTKILLQENIKRKLSFLIGIMISLPIIVFSIINTSLFQSFLERTYSDGHLGNAALGRVGNVSIENFISDSSVYHIFLGYGLINLEDYLPGLARWIYSYGCVGLMVLLIILSVVFIKSDKIQRTILIFFLILNLGTEVMLGYYILLYYPFLLITHNRIRRKEDDKQVIVRANL